MTKGVYILEVRWAWDNSNTEYATITVEEPDFGFEELLKKNAPQPVKEMLLNQLKKVADAIGQSVLGKGKIECLYRIEGENPDQKWVQRKEDPKTGVVTLNMRMVPVCKFDSEGNPILVKANS